jgi:hypothetical protein
MGELIERVKLNFVYGDGIVDIFKNNSLYFYQKYLKSDDEVKSINVNDIKPGYFYFFHYKDDSNWLKWSPVFVADFKKFSNKIIFLCVNFNFIPLEIRPLIFDKFMTDKNFDKNLPLKVNFQGMYSELTRYKFEYSVMEFDALRIAIVHRIDMNSVYRFLYSQHPKNKYDPQKLIQIWKSKESTRNERHNEMMTAQLSDFFDVESEISDKYDALSDHIKRLRANSLKYGK